MFEYEWNGSNPSLDAYDVVILLDAGEARNLEMPEEGQKALVSFVRNGGGLILSEWITEEHALRNAYQDMADLILFDPARQASGAGMDTFTCNTALSHPITEGVDESFTTPYLYGNTGPAKDGALVVVSGGLFTDAVAVDTFELGRIVHFATTGDEGSPAFSGSEQMSTLLVNAVNWAARRSKAGYAMAAVYLDNSGTNDVTGELALDSDLILESEDVTLASGQGQLFEYDMDTSGMAEGPHELTATVYLNGFAHNQVEAEVEVEGPLFELVSWPMDPAFGLGEEGSMTFEIENQGMNPGMAEIQFQILDILDATQWVWIESGTHESVTFNFAMPDDALAGNYTAQISVDGKLTEIPFTISGLDIDVSASLDKAVYQVGDTAVLTIDITNQSDENPDVSVRVLANLDEYIEELTLDATNRIQFSIPVEEDAPSQISLMVYHSDGRSIYINTIPLYLAGDVISLFPDQSLYEAGDTVVINVLTTQSGDLWVSGPAYEDTLAVSGDTSFEFVLPEEMTSGSYSVDYTFNGVSGTCLIYVKGYTLKCLELTLDKPIYEPRDTLQLSCVIDASQAVSVLFQGWIYDPDNNVTEAFETYIDLEEGENRLTVGDIVIDAGQEGYYQLVYGLYKADTLLYLMSSAEYFEVQAAAITRVATGDAVYGQAGTIDAEVFTYACGPFAGEIEMSLENDDGDVVEEKRLSVSLEGEQTHPVDIGPAPVDDYTLTARLQADDEVVSEKQTVFSVADLTAPAKPAGLLAGSSGRTVTLTWSANSEADLAGYYVYRNDSRLNRVLTDKTTYQNENVASEVTYTYAITAVDQAGNESIASDTVSVLLDGEAPRIETSPSTDVSSSGKVVVTYTVTDNHDSNPVIEANYPSPAEFSLIGDYTLTVRATDAGGNSSQKTIHITIQGNDTDGDGMDDDWEMTHFGTLERDGTGDFDGDGISDLDEYLGGTNPAFGNAPTLPVILSPADKAEIAVFTPELTIENSTDPDGDVIYYTFELCTDKGMTELLASEPEVSQGEPNTSWQVPVSLSENTRYYWRVRANDESCFTEWVNAEFFVNTQNDPPGDFEISSPASGVETDTLTPVLEVTGSVDPDEDTLTYNFEVYTDEQMADLAVAAYDIPARDGGTTRWTVNTPLEDNTWYYWRAVAVDENGLETSSRLSSFFVNTANDAPGKPAILSPEDGTETTLADVDLTVTNAVDIDGDALDCFFEIDTTETFGGPDIRRSGALAQGSGTTTWQVNGLADNTDYFWRAKASDGQAESPWVSAAFFVNTQNDAPTAPVVSNPGDWAWVTTLSPTLELFTCQDPDNDTLTYEFELYIDSDLNHLAAAAEADTPKWTVTPELTDNTWYYWRGRARDEHGAAGEWSEVASFFTQTDGTDDPPHITLLSPDESVTVNSGTYTISWEDADPDSAALISLYHDTDNTGGDGTLIVSGLEEDPDGTGDTHVWDISGLSEGTYYVYADIFDDTSVIEAAYAPGSVSIDRTAPVVTAEPAEGDYQTLISVALTTDEVAVIHFTLDGTTPDADSAVYSGPIDIHQDTLLGYNAVDPAGNTSETHFGQYTISITNEPPVADIAEIGTVPPGQSVFLDGTGSTDPDNLPGPLTYDWAFVTLPAQSTLTNADIQDDGTALAWFVPDVTGSYEVRLEVSDGLASTEDTVWITVTAGGPGLASCVMVAHEMILMHPLVSIIAGDLAVIEPEDVSGRPGIYMGPGGYAYDSVTLYADHIYIARDASVDHVRYNRLTNYGDIRGSDEPGLDVPLDMTLPLFPEAGSGGPDIVVPYMRRMPLDAGQYGDVTLAPKAAVILTGGRYYLDNLIIGQDCRLLCRDAVELVIKGGLRTGVYSQIGPLPDSDVSAADILIVAYGQTENNGFFHVNIGMYNTIKANIATPNGMMAIRPFSWIRGAFMGQSITTGHKVVMSLDNGFE